MVRRVVLRYSFSTLRDLFSPQPTCRVIAVETPNKKILFTVVLMSGLRPAGSPFYIYRRHQHFNHQHSDLSLAASDVRRVGESCNPLYRPPLNAAFTSVFLGGGWCRCNTTSLGLSTVFISYKIPQSRRRKFQPGKICSWVF